MPISINNNRQVWDEAGIAYTVGSLIFPINARTKVFSLKDCDEMVYVEIIDIHKHRSVLSQMSKESTNLGCFDRLFWPEKLVKLEDSSGYTGFICSNPHIWGNLTSLQDIIAERASKSTVCLEEKQFYLTIGIHLAEVVNMVHKCGYKVGVLSPEELWVSDEGKVYLCAAYQFLYKNENAFGNPIYVAPEWLDQRNCGNVSFDYLSDSFLYAIILFQLLTGKYPFFTERNILTVKKEELWKAMLDGKSYYYWGGSSIDINIEEKIGQLFRRTFDYCGYVNYSDDRPEIIEWLTLLSYL